jgi:hypothetical protein
MSYWNQIEVVRGRFTFGNLDNQIKIVKKYGGEVTLCIGQKQPHWPELHRPSWADELAGEELRVALYAYIAAVVEHYKPESTIVSWQLENEALIHFGHPTDRSRKRLREEFMLIKNLDTSRPVIMTLSDSWGLPTRKPRPDIFAMSLYRTIYHDGIYRHSARAPWFYRFRALVIKVCTGRPVFIHELQCEPWGPDGNAELSYAEQQKSMSPNQLEQNIRFAASTRLSPIDLWGLEWWYAQKNLHGNLKLWLVAKSTINSIQR